MAAPLFLPPSTAPHAWAESAFTMRADAILTTTHVASTVEDVTGARWITLLINIDGADTSGTVDIILATSNEYASDGSPPLTTDDVWYPPSVTDGSITVVDPAGTKLSNTDWTFQPEWAKLTLRPGFLQFEAVEASTDEIRIRVKVDVADAKWFYFSANAAGAGTLPNLQVKAARSL
jgi:hypothetical protein